MLTLVSWCQCKNTSTTKSAAWKSLTIWNLYDDNKIFNWQIQEFKTKYPWLEINYKKFSNPDLYYDLLVNELAEWNGPDIFTVSNKDLFRHIWKMLPLPVGKTTSPMNPQIFKDTFLDVCSNDLIKDNNVYWIPLYVDTMALYYNKQILWDHFTKWKPEDNWEWLRKQVEAMSKKDNSIEGFRLSWIALWRSDNIERATDILYLLMLQNQTDFYNPTNKKAIFADNQPKHLSWWDINPWKYSLDFYTSFAKPSYKNFSWSDRMTAQYKENSEVYPFISWKTAMIFGYSYLYEDIKSKIKQMKSDNQETIKIDDVWIIETPQIESFSTSSKRDALANYNPFFVSKTSKNPNLAWDFLIFLSSKRSLQDYYEKTNKPSSRQDLLDDQKVEPIYWTFARQATYSKTYPDLIINNNQYTYVFSDMISSINKNKNSSEQALIFGQQQVQCLIDQYYKKTDMYDVNCINMN